MSHPADRQLAELFDLLTPSPECIDRMEQHVLALLDAAMPRDRILHVLAIEWLTLLRSRPAANAALVVAAAFLLLLTTPLSLLPLALLA